MVDVGGTGEKIFIIWLQERELEFFALYFIFLWLYLLQYKISQRPHKRAVGMKWSGVGNIIWIFWYSLSCSVRLNSAGVGWECHAGPERDNQVRSSEPHYIIRVLSSHLIISGHIMSPPQSLTIAALNDDEDGPKSSQWIVWECWNSLTAVLRWVRVLLQSDLVSLPVWLPLTTDQTGCFHPWTLSRTSPLLRYNWLTDIFKFQIFSPQSEFPPSVCLSHDKVLKHERDWERRFINPWPVLDV